MAFKEQYLELEEQILPDKPLKLNLQKIHEG